MFYFFFIASTLIWAMPIVSGAAVALDGEVAAFSVKDFGAKGDGSTDDTDAIQRCITTVESARRIRYNASTGESSYPEVVFPEGNYLISRPIVVAAQQTSNGLLLRGQGKVRIRQTDPDADIFYFHYAFRHWIENFTFEGGRHQLKFFSRNADIAHITISHCRFFGSSDYAIDDLLSGVEGDFKSIVSPYDVEMVDGFPVLKSGEVDDLPDVFYTSTIMRITRCSFKRCMKVLRAGADWACMDHCQIETHPEMTGAAIYARSTIKLDHVTGLAHPRKGKSQRWIDNINGGVILKDVHLKAEGPRGMCPVFNRRIYDNGGQYHVYVIADGCTFTSAGSRENCVVFCEEVPNMVSIRNCRESSGKKIPALRFRKRPREDYFRKVSFPNLVKRSPELARIYGWEVAMPRVYTIGKQLSKHNFVYVLDDNNTNISPGVPSSMRPFLEKPLPQKIKSLFREEIREVVTGSLVTSQLNVRDFGALGDNQTDDTVALQKACEAAGRGQGVELLFPNGIYKISEAIRLPPEIALRGLGGAVFMSDSPIDVFHCDNAIKLSFTNLLFARVRTGAAIQSRPEDSCEIRFQNCNFNLLEGPAIVCESGEGKPAEPNKTRLLITDSTFVRNHQVLVTNAKFATFEYNWVSASRKARDTPIIINKGTLLLADCIGVPGIKGMGTEAKQRWVDNYHNLHVDNFRFGGEAGGACNVLHKRKGGRVLIENSWIYARGSKILNATVYCEAIPEVIALRSNTGIPGDVQKMVLLRTGSGKDLNGRFFESGNTPPASVYPIDTK